MKSSGKSTNYSFPTKQEMYEQYMHSPRTPNPQMYGKHDKVFDADSDASSSEAGSSPYFFETLCNAGWGMFRTIQSVAEEVQSSLGVSPTQSADE